MSINIRAFNDSDIDGCVKLLQRGHTRQFTLERFLWLHKQNPLAPSMVLVAEEDSNIIGCYAAIKKHVAVNGQIFVGARDVDPVVHPDYRGRGVFSQLLAEALKLEAGIDFHINFANDSSLPGFVKAGWVQIGSVPECFYQMTWQQFTVKQIVSWGLSSFKSPLPGPVKPGTGTVVTPVFDDMKADTGTGVAVVRSADYLRWRYVDNPFNKYQFVVDDVNGVAANMVIGIHSQDKKTFYATDFLSREPFEQYSLKWLLVYLQQQGISALRTWKGCPAPVIQQLVCNPMNKNLGGIRVLVKKGAGSKVPDDIFDLERWTITPGDLESI